MLDLSIKNQIDPLLKKLASKKSLDVAEELISVIINLIGIKCEKRELLNIPRIDAELPRFELAPGFARQAAAFKIPVEKNDIFDVHFFHIKKINKTNLSWLVGITPNFEDSEVNQLKNIGIDFVISSSCDKIIILLSNRYKIRSLEIKDYITHTQSEIFSVWKNIKQIEANDIKEKKKILHTCLWDSFNFQPINRKFYFELVEHFSLLVHHLKNTYGRKTSVVFTTRLIGRILFIWFLKKKNLINQNMNYFEVKDPYNQINYYKSKIEILFFETLNKEISERKHGDITTPYLNGGLFDISSTDFFNDEKLSFPNGYFNQLFETLNKYNFTVDESSPDFQQVAIDPEMLGQIFESLLSEEIDEVSGNSKKKITGAFYTPREIVNYMCEQSILEYLKSRIPYSPNRDKRFEELINLPETIFRDQDQNKRRDWKPYSEAIIKALEGENQDFITILDPSVGSGAFPMGMLHILTKIYGRLDSKYEKNVSRLKRSILSKSLYGVDIEPTAIEICRLRAWLSIVVDIPEGEEIEPLPNLDFKFACANTLIPLDDDKQASFLEDYNLKDNLITLRDNYFSVSNLKTKQKLRLRYDELTHKQDLFDSKRAKQLKSYKPFDISTSSDFYDPDLHHGIKKFDIVIGNPPYVQIQKFSKQVFQKDLENVGYTSFSKTGDLYCLFYEQGINFLKPGGILMFITSNKWMKAAYGEKLRALFLKNNPILLVNLGSYIFESATVDTNILAIKKMEFKDQFYGVSFVDSSQNIFININKYINEKKIKLNNLDKSSWNIGNEIQQNLKKKIENTGRQLKLWELSTNRGIITGLNEAFIIDQKTYDEIISEDNKSKEIIWPILRGRDLFRYKYNYKPLGKYVILVKFSSYLSLKSRYPAIFSHLSKFEDQLRQRGQCKSSRTGKKVSEDYDGQHHWLELDNNPSQEYLDLFKAEKIAWSDISSEPNFSLIKDPLYINNTAYIISAKENLYYFLGILNSSLVKWYLPKIATDLGDKGIRYFKHFVEKIPIPEFKSSADNNLKDKVEQLVTKIHDLRRIKNDIDISLIEKKIDYLVYKLYKLTPEEIEVINFDLN